MQFHQRLCSGLENATGSRGLIGRGGCGRSLLGDHPDNLGASPTEEWPAARVVASRPASLVFQSFGSLGAFGLLVGWPLLNRDRHRQGISVPIPTPRRKVSVCRLAEQTNQSRSFKLARYIFIDFMDV